MPVTESTRTDAGLDPGNYNQFSLIPLNDLFNERMRKVQARFNPGQVIVRCASLPLFSGNREEISHLFDTLISMILHQPPNGPKLFLYVDCAESAESRKAPKEAKQYLIKFNTNLTTS